nr:reverse transcriptase domain-containing protein [Tanacetum cinerariifolium]
MKGCFERLRLRRFGLEVDGLGGDSTGRLEERFFPPSKTTNLHNEITRFQQRFDESFYEAWERFNDLLRACPHHGFSELHQLDTFYNALNINDQDSLNSAAGGNFLDKMPRECLKIIESKSKVRQSQAKAVVAKNVKEAMTDPAWIKSVQEELLQFKKMDVWVLVPIPDNISPLTLKWIFKNKHDEEQTNHFIKGTIDPTLFIRRFNNDILV